jgi:trehalose-6-phosphatase
MVAAGILRHDERLELLDGAVVQMPPIQPPHAAVVNRLNALLSRLVGDTAIISVQNPIQLNNYTEPQPDLTLLAPHAISFRRTFALPEHGTTTRSTPRVE